MCSTIITGSKFIKLTLLTASYSLLLIISGCGLFSDPGLEHYNYHSYITYNVYPEQDTINVGDTLWISASFSNLFNDLYSTKKTTYSEGFNLFVGIEEIKFGISPDPLTDFGAYYQPMKFNFHSVEGTSEYTSVGSLLQPAFLNGAYKVKIGIIPKEEGLFLLEDAGGNPLNSGVSMILYQNFNVTDVNRHLIPDTFPKVQAMLDNFTVPKNTELTVRNRAYCFYVKK